MAKKAASDKGTGKKKKKPIILIVIILVLVIAGTVFGLAFAGILKIPGITPKSKLKKGAVASRLYAEKKEPPKPAATPKPEPTAENKPEQPAPEPPKTDIAKGAAALAEFWADLPEAKILEISKGWDKEDLARVLALLEPKKTAAVLALMTPKQASDVSQEIQRQASLVEPKS